MIDLPLLLEKAKDGTLSAHEARAVAGLLREHPSSGEAYTAIHILGRGWATGYRELVASFLDSPGDPMLARIALTVLVGEWGLGAAYRDELRAFARGVDWDDEDDVRLVALSATGELVRTTGDHELLSDLLAIAADSGEDILVRDTAFDAIARAVGAGYAELRRRSKLPAGDPWADSILERARALAG